jgi:hypothetical protein
MVFWSCGLWAYDEAEYHGWELVVEEAAYCMVAWEQKETEEELGVLFSIAFKGTSPVMHLLPIWASLLKGSSGPTT